MTGAQARGGMLLMRACMPLMTLGTVQEKILLAACRERGRVDDLFALLAQLLLDINNVWLNEVRLAVSISSPAHISSTCLGIKKSVSARLCIFNIFGDKRDCYCSNLASDVDSKTATEWLITLIITQHNLSES